MTTATGGSSGLWQDRSGDEEDHPGARRTPPGERHRHGQGADAARLHFERPLASDGVLRANINGTGERKLTTFNDALNSEVAWSDAERFTYKSVDDLEIEGWLMKPYGYEAGKKYPLVLYIHGGPHSAYGEGWFDEFQSLAGARHLRAVHESARLERHERDVHVREPRRLGRQGLR